MMVILALGMDELLAQPADLAGKAYRLVWAQDQETNTDVYGIGKQSVLMKFDSTLGRAEPLLDRVGSYGNPMLSPDGTGWCTPTARPTKCSRSPSRAESPDLVADGFAAELWRDPASEEDIVFVATEGVGYPGLPAWGHIGRKPLHAAGPPTAFWKATETMANNFQLSADGRVASGQFPWPIGGIAVPETERWYALDRGCWPSLAPDNSYLFWQFDGAHRNVVMQDPVTRDSWTVRLNNAPGLHDYEVYHPRWSNHPRHMVYTGPYKAGTGGNRIKFGGPDVEVYIGTFAEDLSRLERSDQITHNDRADFFPDLWVEGGRGAVSSLPQRDGFVAEHDTDYSLYYGWETAKADNRGPAGEALKTFHLFDKAYLGPNHEVVLRGRGGHCNPIGDHTAFRSKVGRTLAFTIEGCSSPPGPTKWDGCSRTPSATAT